MTRILYSILYFTLIIGGVQAQSNVKVDVALEFFNQNLDKWELKKTDINTPIISDMYTNKAGHTHIYFTQAIDGIPVYNAITAVVVDKNNKIYNAGHSFISDINKKMVKNSISLSATDAVKVAAEAMGVKNPNITSASRIEGNTTYYGLLDFAHNEIEVSKSYVLVDGKLHLAYDMDIDPKSSADYYRTLVDVSTGEILQRDNYLVKCQVESHSFGKHHNCGAVAHKHEAPAVEEKKTASSAMMGAQYNVFAVPAESPIHGPQVLVTDPHYVSASPYGWHDTDGVEGAEYTITRGNNVHAYPDQDDDEASDGNEPDGGDELIFDYSYDTEINPAENIGLSTTNLFYAVNIIHDITYQLGFDEVSGNFQDNNYGNGGDGNDKVRAQSIDGFTLDEPTLNNANFATPPDGSSGSMQMFLWDKNAGAVYIDEPEELKGFISLYGTGQFGGSIPTSAGTAITGNLALINDGSIQDETDGCQDIINVEEITGKIAMIDRGTCPFSFKVRRAEAAGAVAAIICNIVGAGGDGEEVIGMSIDENEIDDITIPSIFVPKSVCDAMKASIASGIDVTMSLQDKEIQGATYLDGALDNGIVFHEFGHGLSNRLAGGPNTASCLTNNEQPGEGISDFMSLLLTSEEGDTGPDARGIGNYADDGPANGKGIRNYPYSTDMNINPLTHNDLKNIDANADGSQYPVGEIWTSILWDMYWGMRDLYGYDGTWLDHESGNVKAGKLFVQGMKLQNCNATFINMRNAILQADSLLYNGENGKLLWTVFARRGLGYKASSGSGADLTDGETSFEVLPTIIKTLKISKEITSVVKAGEVADVTLDIANHVEETQETVTVTDQIPAGMEYVEGSASREVTIDGANLIFSFENMAYKDEATITYQLLAQEGINSTALYYEDLEDVDESEWKTEAIEGFLLWEIDDEIARSGEEAWYAADVPEEVDMTLEMPEFLVEGERPVLKFWHRYDTEAVVDAGFIQASTDGGDTWYGIDDHFVRNGYSGSVDYSTFAIPSLSGYSGTTGGEFIDTYIDLSAYKGENLTLRFRFGTNETLISTAENPGWFIDDISIIDLKTVGTIACIDSPQEGVDMVCTEQVEIIYDADDIVNGVEDILGDNVLGLYPNPATQMVSISIDYNNNEDATLAILSIDGRRLLSQTMTTNKNKQVRSFDISSLPSGVYLVEFRTATSISTKKLVKN